MIGILCGHDESLVPQNPEYSVFFDLLREYRQRTEPLEGELTAEALAGCDAILLGEPHAYLEDAEVEALRSWIAGGGSLFLLASMGGDDAPGGNYRFDSNLGEIVELLSFNDNAVGVAQKQRTAGVLPFNTQVEIDIAALTRQPGAVLCYDTGCTMSCSDHSAITHALWASAGASVVEGVRLTESEVAVDELPRQARDEEYLFLRLRFGEGSVTSLGASWSLKNETLARNDNVLFLNWLLPLWLTRLAGEETRNRMARPQRHRLLHGYPMAPLMAPLRQESELSLLEEGIALGDRELVVGVLPHPFCNPAVKGCGFCTFPQEVFSTPKASAVVEAVIREIEGFVRRYPSLRGRPVKALYFGGGTANLTPPDAFRALCQSLAKTFDLRGAEITLEGVPAYFLVRQPRLLEILPEALPARSYRISMGIQTFDERQLRRMGRSAFGNPATFAEVAQVAHSLGYSVSGDLLFNLPGQTLGQMRQDISKALSAGLDHICLYHLVMFDGLGTEWSTDAALLSQLPQNEAACANWLALRELLLENCFGQTTLTNFEGPQTFSTERRFLYEECVLSPERYDWLGFGPSAISLFVDRDLDRALKLVNPESSAEYLSRAPREGGTWSGYFSYAPRDLKILYLTRKIARLGVDRGVYSSFFQADPVRDFEPEFAALKERKLLLETESRLELTPSGMFYADTIAGLLAWRQVSYQRLQKIAAGFTPRPEVVYYGKKNEARFFRMG